MDRREPPRDHWKAAKDRRFVQLQDDRFSGSLAGHACSIAMVPISHGALGVLTKVDVDSSLWGNLYRLDGIVAKHMFEGGSQPQATDERFASRFRVRADGAPWIIDETSCALMEDLQLEYIQAVQTSLSFLCVSEVPPDEPMLARMTRLVEGLARANRRST